MMRDSLGDRMKAYESVASQKLMRRTPVICRLDGRSFHTFTRGFDKPFDNLFMKAMHKTLKQLCENVGNCVFGYTQSDEITLVLIDYRTFDSYPWYGNRIEKICSISASMATRFFNKAFIEVVGEAMAEDMNNEKDYSKYTKRFFSADFDCRAFNVPREDVCNCLIWRQKDAERNSIQGLAQSLFKFKEIQGVSNNDLQDKMFVEKGVNWNDMPVAFKRGIACIRDDDGDWFLDEETPIFTQNRAYIEDYVYLRDKISQDMQNKTKE